MPKYFVRVTQRHDTFRFPSLLSAAQCFGFDLKILTKPEDYFRGVLVVEVDKEEHIERLLDRGILILWIAELYASGETFEELDAELKSKPEVFDPWRDKVFKITSETCNLRISAQRERDNIMRFAYTNLRGPVNLSKPEVEFVVFEDYDLVNTSYKADQLAREGQFKHVYFGRRIGHSRARPYVHAHAVKTREYFGNTSMESEMSFLMAGQTLSAPGKIVYDPFVGTGSLLYACARYGALVMGSDIDGRQMRGKTRGKGVAPGIVRTAAQYGVDQQLLGCVTFDITKNGWRKGGWMDAIITDPPYGVRAGAKRLGKNPVKGRETREEAFIMPDGTPSHLRDDYIPPQRPYELMHLTLDLIRFARYMLVPGGRLVFFLPTVTEEYDAIDIPIVEGMKELKWGEGSVQDFGKWGRRLVTMEKVAGDDGPRPTFDDYSILEGKTAGHQHFNKKFAQGFRKTPQDPKTEST